MVLFALEWIDLDTEEDSELSNAATRSSKLLAGFPFQQC